MNRFIIMILLFGTLSIQKGMAQAIEVLRSKITWTSSASLDVKTGNAFTKEMKFITYANDRIEVPNRNGAQVFDITSVEGTWTDVNQSGRLVYQVTMNGEQGIITLERTAEGIYLTIDMSISSIEGIKRKFTIGKLDVK